MPICEITGIDFELDALERGLQQRLGVPAPQMLPALRLRHRLTFRNERTLYKRDSSLTGKPIISIYAPESPYPIYSADEWWSDKWDGENFGRPFDFKRPFFEQFAALQRVVPRIALFNVNPHNSDYCQQAYNNKNCYLCTVLKDCEDSMYISHINRARDCFDCDYLQDAELSYDCLDSTRLYGCIGSDNCQNSNGLIFCTDCIGCSDCIGSSGLRNQRHCIENVQVSPADYEKIRAGMRLTSRSAYLAAASRFRSKFSGAGARTEFNINVVDSLGNHLINAKNCHHCYDSFQIEDCSNCTWIFESHHCADVYGMGTSEWVYESIGVENLNFAAFNTFVSDSSNSFYSDLCFYSQNIFGCVGLRRKKNCILNVEYSQSEFDELSARIIEHMKNTGEWGRFFPAKFSPFAYNESVAAERFALEKDAITELGYRWREPEARTFKEQQVAVPDDTLAAGDEITKAVLSCEASGANFRITPQELAFYRKMGLPLPTKCPDARYLLRMERRNC